MGLKCNMSPDDLCRVRYIVDALNSAMQLVRGRQRTDLASDEMLLFALMRAVEIVGEAASKLI